ncbi:hypothetical protein [Salegentibacter holothuriorum]|uniref:hypothetical protein n=1 Tax=Salegentibacter holothuriorum TaxID=241145 RepID=UPI001116185B|nr:hypothetical protein [Salegentibacter holothuriorum]
MKNLNGTYQTNSIKQTWYAENTIKYGIIRNLKKGNIEVSKKLLKAKFISNQKLNYKDKWKELIRLHEDGVKALYIPKPAKYKLIHFYSNLVSRTLKYADLNLSKPVFLDEGIIHNNCCKLNDLSGFESSQICFPKLVLYLEADVLEVANEIKKNNSFESRGMAEFNFFSLSEIATFLKELDCRNQEKIIFLKENKIPVIKLNRKNSQTKIDFIRINREINEILKKGL